MIIDIHGVHYTYDIKGSGPPVLLLHGFTGSMATWTPFLPLWSQKFQTITVDIIGHGNTDAPAQIEPYTMPFVAEALTALLHENGITKTNVLGYSMGGRLALYLALKCPSLVGSVLLESASPGLATEEEKDARIEHDEALAAQILRNGVTDFVDEWEKLPLFKTQDFLPESIKKRVRTERLSHTPLGLANSLKGMGTGKQPSLWDFLSTCEKRVMLVVGSLDNKFLNIASTMEEELPHCKKIVVEGCGHAVHVESPEIFGRIVSDEFRRIVE